MMIYIVIYSAKGCKGGECPGFAGCKKTAWNGAVCKLTAGFPAADLFAGNAFVGHADEVICRYLIKPAKNNQVFNS